MASIALHIYAFFFGTAFGSFANVLIGRLHSGEGGILTGRSHCPFCKHELGGGDMIPIFSWLLLKAKCRYCRKKISPEYPLVELAMGLSWLFVAVMTPINVLNAGVMEWGHFGYLLFAMFILLVLTIYDLKYMEVPDQISLFAIFILLLTLPLSFTPHWQDAFIGGGIAAGFFLVLFLISKGTWIGGGDIRLGAIMGLLLGWQQTLLGLFIAYAVGALISIFLLATRKKGRKSQIPFGPFLMLGTFVMLFWGEGILEWYVRLVGW